MRIAQLAAAIADAPEGTRIAVDEPDLRKLHLELRYGAD